MKIIFSPSKSQRSPLNEKLPVSPMMFPEKTSYLVRVLQTYQQKELQSIFKISEALSNKVHQYYKNFSRYLNPAIELFSGTSFRQLDIYNYGAREYKYLNKHLYILSALYGVLRPQEMVSPYRLDMNDRINEINLYDYWEHEISDLFKNEDSIINLASDEYAKILKDESGLKIIDIQFLVEDNSTQKAKSFELKKQRGKILNWMVLNQVSDIKRLREYKSDGFVFSENLSREKVFVFLKID